MTNSKKFIIGITGSTGVLGEQLTHELKDFDIKFFKGDKNVKKVMAWGLILGHLLYLIWKYMFLKIIGS